MSTSTASMIIATIQEHGPLALPEITRRIGLDGRKVANSLSSLRSHGKIVEKGWTFLACKGAFVGARKRVKTWGLP